MSAAATHTSRAASALVAAITLTVAPWADAAFAPAHSALARIFGQGLHLVGHNDWAYADSMVEVYAWIALYAALALVWLGAGFALRSRAMVVAAWSAQLAAGLLALGAGAAAEWLGSGLGPALLHLADLGSPWWSCPAVLLALALRERDRLVARCGALYAALLAACLLLPGLSGTPSTLLLAAVAAGPQVLPAIRWSRLRVARWMRGSA